MKHRTFKDVREFVLNSNRHTPSYAKKLAGRLSSYARKSNRTLSSIPADLQIFEREFGKGRSDPIPAGYKTQVQADTAASEIRSALTAYLESQNAAPGKSEKTFEGDEWDILHKALKASGTAKQKLIAVTVLMRKCRDAGRQPHEVSHGQLMELIRGALTAGEYKAIQDGWHLVEANADELSRLIKLPDDLPFPSLAKTRNVCQRLPLPPVLSQEWTDWETNKLNPVHIGMVKRDLSAEKNLNFGTKRVSLKSYREGLTYYYTCLRFMGHLGVDDDPNLLSIIDEELIIEVICRELNGDFPWQVLRESSLHGNITRLLLIAKDMGFDVKSIRERMGRIHDFKNIKKMVPQRKAWCRRLIADHDRASAFYKLPAETFKTAKSLMKDYDMLSVQGQQRAIKASIAACAFSILLSLPFRIGTLLQLKHSGEQANVFAFQHKTDLIVNSTPDMVKNGYAHERVSLTPKSGGSPKEIVKWFIEVAHPILVKDQFKQGRCDPSLLFAGIGYHRLYHAIVDHAVGHGIDLTPHLFRHGIATLLANEPQADYSLIAALLGDTVQTVMSNYAFVDQAKLHIAGQEKLANSQKNILRVKGKS